MRVSPPEVTCNIKVQRDIVRNEGSVAAYKIEWLPSDRGVGKTHSMESKSSTSGSPQISRRRDRHILLYQG